MPVVCAFGTLNTTRDEQLPAVEGDLQIADLVVEDRRIERDAARRIFHAGLVVPQRLVVVRAETAEDGESAGVHSGTLSGSLMPPRRKPFAACTLTLR